MTTTFQIEVRDSLADVPVDDWNALDDSGYPFVRHEFLHGLEATGCLGPDNGWYPRYLLLRRIEESEEPADDTGGAPEDGSSNGNEEPRAGEGELVGAVPAYVKTNSYGEFVFDWAWADAYQRHGLDYYPKLVASIPFTPATGPRLLVRGDQPYAETVRLLAVAVRQFAAGEKYSGAHFLFLTERESEILSADAGTSGGERGEAEPEDERHEDRGHEDRGHEEQADAVLPDGGDHLRRLDCQYHWHDGGYATFDEFLDECTSKRRKTIRRERRHVTEAGLTLSRRRGDTLSAAEWHEVHRLYSSTYDRKWGRPSLSEAFFRRMGETFGEHTLVVLAHDPDDADPARPVACSIMFSGGGTLYGRYWGCRREYNSLHFEACYYQGIEHCIEQGIAHFEPGAQGEHKITRGFVPTLTRSAHWIAHPQFRDAISRFLDEETRHVERRCEGLAELLPFKAEITPP